MDQRVAIIGSGALGKYLHSLNLEAGISSDLFSIHRGVEYYQTVRESGITVFRDHTCRIYSTEVYSLHEMRGSYSLIVIATKQRSNSILLNLVPPRILKPVPIVLIQNGWDTGFLFSKAFPHHPLYIGVTQLAITNVSDHSIEVHHTGLTHMAPYRNDQKESLLDRNQVFRWLLSSGMKYQWIRSWKSAAFEKILVNAIINPLTALYKKPNGFLLQAETLKPLVDRLLEEGIEIGLKMGIPCHKPSLESYLHRIVTATGGNRSSMLQDMQAKQPTEIDGLTGKLIELGEEYGVSTPTHRTIYYLIKVAEECAQNAPESSPILKPSVA